MKKFDELQIINRGKISFQTLILTLVLIFINGFFKDMYGVWGDYITESVILIFIPSLYFVTMTIFKDAYTYQNNTNIKISIVIFAVLALLNLFLIINSIYSGVFKIIDDGKITSSLEPIVNSIFFGYTSIILLIKHIMNKKSSKLEG